MARNGTRPGPYSGGPGGMCDVVDIPNHSDKLHEGKMIYVGNLAYSVNWQDLKDHMSQAGTVEFARILTEDGTEFGRSRGTGYVRYTTEADAENAIVQLRETELKGRKILVDAWTGSSGKGRGMGGLGCWKGFGPGGSRKGASFSTPMGGKGGKPAVS